MWGVNVSFSACGRRGRGVVEKLCVSEMSSRRCIELVVEETEREKKDLILQRTTAASLAKVSRRGRKEKALPSKQKKAVAFEATSDRIPPMVMKLWLGLFRSRSETFRFFPSEI